MLTSLSVLGNTSLKFTKTSSDNQYTTPTPTSTTTTSQDPRILCVATGRDTSSGYTNSVEFLTAGDTGIYSTRQIDSGGICSDVKEFPVETRNPVGAIFNSLIHICPGGANPKNQTCFKYQQDGSWESAFELTSSLDAGSGQSVVFGDSNGAPAWWILQGLQDVTGSNVFSTTTELWGNDPPSQITDPVITLPMNLNLQCVVNISDTEALVVGRPDTITGNDLSYSWKFNYNDIYQTAHT